MMSDWHPCLPGHPWGADGWCDRCGAYEPEKDQRPADQRADPRDVRLIALEARCATLVAVIRIARDKLHAANRPEPRGNSIRIQVRDYLDQALEQVGRP